MKIDARKLKALASSKDGRKRNWLRKPMSIPKLSNDPKRPALLLDVLQRLLQML